MFRQIKVRGWLASISVMTLGLDMFGLQLAFTQIHSTKHNLTGSTANVGRGASSQVCLSCHTPFGNDPQVISPPVTAPLWSPNEPLTSFRTYSSLGTAGLVGANAPVGSTSLLCLSCHDGVVAMNVNVNPGRNTNTPLAPGAANDHPIGVPYGGGAVSEKGPPLSPGTYSNTLMRDISFRSAQMTLLNGVPVWWVDTGSGNPEVREKTDMQLYTQADTASTGGPVPLVECASCHDPHTATPVFLRVPNTGSAVCLSCHNI